MFNSRIYEQLEREAAETETQFPPTWEPVDGASIAGKIAKITMGKSLFGICPVVQILDERTNQKQSLWVSHAVLRSWFEREQPQMNDVILVKCIGKHEKGYLNFRAVIHRDHFSWKALQIKATEINQSNGDARSDLTENGPISPCSDCGGTRFYQVHGTEKWSCLVCTPVPAEVPGVKFAESAPF